MLNPQAQVHINDIIQTQLRMHQGFESVMKMTQLVVAGIITVASKLPQSELHGIKPLDMLDHFRDNVAELLKLVEIPEDVLAVELLKQSIKETKQ